MMHKPLENVDSAIEDLIGALEQCNRELLAVCAEAAETRQVATQALRKNRAELAQLKALRARRDSDAVH